MINKLLLIKMLNTYSLEMCLKTNTKNNQIVLLQLLQIFKQRYFVFLRKHRFVVPVKGKLIGNESIIYGLQMYRNFQDGILRRIMMTLDWDEFCFIKFLYNLNKMSYDTAITVFSPDG